MESESVWLGGARNVILRLAQLSSAITIAVFVIMVFMRMFFGGIGMYEMLRPAGRHVWRRFDPVSYCRHYSALVDLLV